MLNRLFLLLAFSVLLGCAGIDVVSSKMLGKPTRAEQQSDLEQKHRQYIVDLYPEMNEETKQGVLNGTVNADYVQSDLEKKRDEKKVENQRESFIKDHPTISPEIKSAIRGHKVIIGMNQEEVLAAWREPNDKNRTVGAWGVHEQWIYGTPLQDRNYLYFENGKVTSWQESR